MDEESSLSNLQLAVLRVLWTQGAATVQDVQQALAREGRELASTTVATVLSRLEKRNVVRHRQEGRAYTYEPAIEQARVADSMVQRLTQAFFNDDPALLVSHLVDRGQLTAAQRREIQALLNAPEHPPQTTSRKRTKRK